MTPTLRKLHRYTWFLFALLLPLAWFAAIWAIPETLWQAPLHTGLPPQLPQLLQSEEAGDFVVNLRTDSSAQLKQVEIFIKKPQTNPNTSLIIEYSDPADHKKETLLGLLGSRGVWRFDLDSFLARSPYLGLRLEDKIQGRVLRQIEFEP